MIDVDLSAAQLYDQRVAERGPRWDQLGDITKSVWRGYVLDGQTPSHDYIDMLNTKQVCERLGFTMTAPFIIETLGVQPTEKVKNGYFFSEEAFEHICSMLVAHITRMAVKAGAQTVDDLFAEPESCDDLFA